MALKKNEKRGKDMSIMNLIKKMLDRYREEGKSKMEIEEAIREAQEKATVGTVRKKEMEEGEKPKEQSRLWVRETLKAGQTWTVDKDANNWRKMHGIVMKRKMRGAA